MTEHPAHDDLVALALGSVEPAERERLGAHLAGCGACRVAYAELEDAVLHTLAASPTIAPPAGFSGRVLGLLAVEPVETDAGRARRDAGRARRDLLLAAAALAVGLALGIAGTLFVTDRTTAPPVASVPGDVTSASALVTRSGDTVGSAGLAVLAGRDHLVITVTRARPGAAYECVVVGEDGRRRSAGTWTLDARYGGTDASGTWVVEVPEGGIEQVELIGRSGNVWAAAVF